MMASNESPRKRARLESADEECSGDTDLFHDHPSKESEDYASILASQPSSKPWQQWTVEQVAEQLISRDIPTSAVEKIKREYFWLMQRKGFYIRQSLKCNL